MTAINDDDDLIDHGLGAEADATGPDLYPGMPNWERHIEMSLKPFQRYARNFMVSRPSAGIFLTMGGGKTITALSALIRAKPAGHTLVVAPTNIARIGWPREIDEWNIPVRYVSLDMRGPGIGKNGRPTKSRKRTAEERRELYASVLTDPPTLYIISVSLLVELIDYFATEGGRYVTPNYTKWPFRNMLIDESQKFKDPSTKLFKSLRRVRPHIERMFLLSGTPAAENTKNIWPQAYLLDQGQALYDNERAFLTRWFTEYKISPMVSKWNITDANRKEIYDRIRHIALSAENTQLNLPDQHVFDHHVELSATEAEAYRQFHRDSVINIIADHDPDLLAAAQAEPLPGQNPVLVAQLAAEARRKRMLSIVADNAGILNNKLRQFASGALYLSEEEIADLSDNALAEATAITRRPTLAIHNHKIRRLLDIIEQLDEEDNCLIAYNFQSDKERILHWLDKAGVPAVGFDGTREMMDAWNNRQIPVMLIHPASAGHGLNFQHGGRTLVWFNLPYSSEHYQQTNARLRRMGQDREVHIHRIITAGTLDEKLPDVLGRKRRVEAELLEALRSDTANVLDDI